MISDGVRFMRGARKGALALSLAALLTTFATPLAPLPCHAQASEGASYRELIDQALSEFKHRHWPEARVLFQRAHAAQPNARTLRGLGVVSFEMREYVAAITYLQQALDDTRQPLTDAQRSECSSLIGRSRAYVGSYTLSVTPAEARVSIDGAAPVRDREGSVLLSFGEHVLAASAEGYVDGSQRVSVQGNEHGELTLALALVPPPQPEVVAAPAPVPAPKPAAPVEPVTRVEKTGGLKYTWVALGAGAVFGGLAAGAWFMGEKEFDRLDERCRERADGNSPCTRGALNTDKLTRYERLTNAGIGLAAASVLATVTLMAVEWPRERTVTIALGPQSVSLRGAF